MKLLIIEDDKKIVSFVMKGFKQAGFVVDTAEDGNSGLEKASGAPYDAVVLDLMLPKRDGLSVLAEMRKQGIKTPVIVLSAKRTVDERVQGLQAGGDDYLTKPFSFSELLARVQALIRRNSNTPTQEPMRLQTEDLVMDLPSHEVKRGEKKIVLHPREWALLELLLRHSGKLVSKTMIMENVWEYDFDPQTNVVDVLVCRLRVKIDKGFSRKLIHTSRGVGYVLKAE